MPVKGYNPKIATKEVMWQETACPFAVWTDTDTTGILKKKLITLAYEKAFVRRIQIISGKVGSTDDAWLLEYFTDTPGQLCREFLMKI